MMVGTNSAWEQGSFFDDRPVGESGSGPTWAEQPSLFSTGRGALLAAVGISRQLGVTKLRIPTYYCHDVSRYISPHIDVDFYDYGPTAGSVRLDLGPHEAALVPEYFGARADVDVRGGFVLLDRTHDPFADWRYERAPSLVFASLRKTLPLADGAALRAECGHVDLPDPPRSAAVEAVSAEMWAVMAAKRRYLQEGGVDAKRGYLARHASAESELVATGMARMTPQSRQRLRSLPITEMRSQRSRNIAMFRERWAPRGAPVELLDFPSFLVFRATTMALRDSVRTALAQRNIYSAVYWPLGGVAATHREHDLSRRMFLLHADHRYSEADVGRVAAALEDILSEPMGTR
jgi:hypothetical protein